jgi:cold shock CspA family protein
MTGKVKFFDFKRRYGIIVPDGVPMKDRERHVFFYEDTLPEGATVRAGQDVEYSLLPDYPTPRALVVTLLGKTSYVPIRAPRKEAYGTD